MRAALALLGLVASASPAFAGDGAFEIHQACVAAGCFAGDGPGFPVQIQSPGSYVLTSDLTVPDPNTGGIAIQVADVALDLNGFAVRGPVACTGEPVTSCLPAGAGDGISVIRDGFVRGGIVRGFGDIGIAGGTDTRIADVIVTHNGGIGIALSRGASVRNATVTFNGASGITANTGGGFAEVAGCTVRGNAADGVAATAGLIVDSRFQNNGATGITGGAAAGRNVVSGNGGASQVGASIDAIDCNQVSSVVVCPP
ncbi:MAG: hypothetical protein DCC71_06430 [Proteobacteria bacterium]|nr:MAG: hypothetical protein DCC71_06430 [Pseudomonadota bacterium]